LPPTPVLKAILRTGTRKKRILTTTLGFLMTRVKVTNAAEIVSLATQLALGFRKCMSVDRAALIVT
jgi:hypothetical protein